MSGMPIAAPLQNVPPPGPGVAVGVGVVVAVFVGVLVGVLVGVGSVPVGVGVGVPIEQPGILNVPMRVVQPLVLEVAYYSCVYQKVQSSAGSMLIAL